MKLRSNSSLQQMLAEMGIIRNGMGLEIHMCSLQLFEPSLVQQQMQSQISDLRDKLTDAYTEIANMKKTKSQFEQEVHAESQSLSEQLQFKTLELETLKKAYAHTHQQLQQQIIQLQTEVNELRMKGDDVNRPAPQPDHGSINGILVLDIDLPQFFAFGFVAFVSDSGREASVSSAAAAFSQKAFLQRFETEETLEEKLAALEFAQGTRAFDEQVALPTTVDQTLVLLSPFASVDEHRRAVQDLCLEPLGPIETQALLCQRRDRSSPGKPSKALLEASAKQEVQDDKPPRGSRPEGANIPTPLVHCSVPAHPAVCALLLDAQPGERVLDLCGSAVKAAVLACCMFSHRHGQSWLESVGHESGALSSGRREGTLLVSNAPDRTYARSLEPWLQSLLPAEVPVLHAARPGASGHILLSTVEAWQKQSLLPLQRLGPFDRIIVDPSCTGGFGARMPDLKYPELAEALLCNAAKLLRPGGILLYSTVRVEERTMDTVVRGFLRNAKEDFEVLPPDLHLDVASVQMEFGQLLNLGASSQHQCPEDFFVQCHLTRRTEAVEMAAQYANNEMKRLRNEHDQAIASLAENMNRWNDTVRDLSKEFHDFQKVMNVNHQRLQSSVWEVQGKLGPAAPSAPQIEATHSVYASRQHELLQAFAAGAPCAGAGMRAQSPPAARKAMVASR
ncbi:rsmB [Symbiodinium natans]|uniref:RsmB protein n=1 Tax=Symbiodinium natans TaxID=878477 RepID=A0A812II78_9DINO|nr:rsmB [Symbiodinium natans]